VLFVSTIERRKNHEVLYKALHVLAERRQLDPEFKLVFVGMPGWGVADLLKDIELDPLTRGNIVQINHANDAELRRLYEACQFFVYPSFYEGWGLPVAEALALGKFVLASDRGSIPEVAGSLVEYVDPWNATAWADAIARYWTDEALLAERTHRVQSEYRQISWDAAAETVLALIDQLQSAEPDVITIEPGYAKSRSRFRPQPRSSWFSSSPQKAGKGFSNARSADWRRGRASTGCSLSSTSPVRSRTWK
jgi:glycosyltransferase involved in cell wall biosynthesis